VSQLKTIMPILKIEPFSGVSGDLFVGALAQLAENEAAITALPAQLGLEGVHTHWETVDKCGISCRKVSFHEASSPDNPDHHHHSHSHHSLPPSHSSDAVSSHGPHRHLSDILHLIDHADLPEGAKTRAKDIFQSLGEAEASVHGVDIEQVHFHEVGAVDSIMDIVGSALLLDQLGVHTVYCDPVVTGKGFAQMAHGRFPIPAPATQQLLQGMVIEPGSTEAELTTPTGAAILKHLNPCFATPALTLVKTAMAGATKEFDHPNVLRLSLCEQREASGELTLLQTNIDDMPPELLGQDLLSHLLEQGARDAWITPIIMKKGRPAHKLEVLCDANQSDALANRIMECTTSIGVRILPLSRKELPREHIEVSTPWGTLQAKQVTLPSGAVRVTPEYEDGVRLAEEAGVSLLAIYQALGRNP